MDRVEKSLFQSMNSLRSELEMNLNESKDRTEEVYDKTNNIMESVNLKLSRVEEAERLRKWTASVIDEAKVSVKCEISQTIC